VEETGKEIVGNVDAKHLDSDVIIPAAPNVGSVAPLGTAVADYSPCANKKHGYVTSNTTINPWP
jgi:hypothetical protein